MKSYKKNLFFSVLFSGIPFFVASTSILFLLEKGFTPRTIAALRGLQAAIILCTDIPLGYLADQYSKRFSVILGFFLFSAYLFCVGFFHNKSMIFFAEVCAALSFTFTGGASGALMMNNYKKEEGTENLRPIISKEVHYRYLGMCVALGAGMFCPMDKLRFLWLLSAAAMLFLAISALFFLPGDGMQQRIAGHVRSGSLFRKIGRDFALIKRQMTPAVLYHVGVFVVVMGFFNVLINYNQIVIRTFSPSQLSEQTWWYTVMLILIILFQALAGKVLTKRETGYAPAIVHLIVSSIILIAFSVSQENHPRTLLLLLLLFSSQYFSIVLITTHASSSVHTTVEDAFRATVDSAMSTLFRAVSVGIFFLVGLAYAGVRSLSIVSLSVCMIVVFIKVVEMRMKSIAVRKKRAEGGEQE